MRNYKIFLSILLLLTLVFSVFFVIAQTLDEPADSTTIAGTTVEDIVNVEFGTEPVGVTDVAL